MGDLDGPDSVGADRSRLWHAVQPKDWFLAQTNRSIVQQALADSSGEDASKLDVSPENDNGNRSKEDDNDTPANEGKLIVDATCMTADVAYPTDLSLINKARERSEEILDGMLVLSAFAPGSAPINKRPAKPIWLWLNRKNPYH